MSDDLRARIAKALQGEADDGFTWEDWLPLADAVIRELGLREEHRERSYGNWPNQPQAVYRKQHRYVTEWKADD